ncbi:MAG: ferric reductase-like transmembrane domain-containing protein [Patescibacteria group bacterium]
MDSSPAAQKDWQTRIFEIFARLSPKIILLFHLFNYAFATVVVILGYLEFTNSNLAPSIYSLGKHFGQLAVTLLGIVVLPGILGRLRIEIKLTRLITLFRRQLGITVFVLGLSHYLLIRFVPTLAGIYKFEFPYPVLFENFGALALFILFWLFITSNNASVKKMSIWWKRLHRFVYVAVWLLVFHTGLQRLSVWTMGIGIVAILEAVSLIYDYFRKKNFRQS